MRTGQMFVVSDLHLGHGKAALSRGFESIEEHDEELIARWNSVVTHRDVVYNLGDVIFSPSTKMHLLDRLNCRRHYLVVGNHEHHDIKRYAPFFSKIRLMQPYKERYLFTHMPVHRSQLEERFKGMVNVHGHLHDHEVQLEDNLYFNVNCEFTGLAPLNIDELGRLIKERL